MEQLVRFIRQADEVVVVSHTNPDGDAVGSVMAMVLGLAQQQKKRIIPVIPGGIPETFSYLSSPGFPVEDRVPAYDPEVKRICLVLDAPDAERTNSRQAIELYADNNSLGFIDHHPKGNLARLSGPYSYHNLNSSSTAELCYHLLVTMDIKLTPLVSTALLTGIYTDTGAFQFSNTSPRTLEIAAELMRRGGKLAVIAEKVSRHKTVAGLRILGKALENTRVTCRGLCTTSILTYKELTDVGASGDDVAGIIGHLNVLPGTVVTLLLIETEPGSIRGSLRAGDGAGRMFTVNTLAKLLGGGGHPKAAGFTMAGHITTRTLHDGHISWQIT